MLLPTKHVDVVQVGDRAQVRWVDEQHHVVLACRPVLRQAALEQAAVRVEEAVAPHQVVLHITSDGVAELAAHTAHTHAQQHTQWGV